MALFHSERFWGLVAVAALQVLIVFNVVTSEQGEALIQIVQSLIVGVVAVGSLDRVGKLA